MQVKVTIHLKVTMTTSPSKLGQVFHGHLWEYPGLYDLLAAPKHVFLNLMLHLCHPTLPRPLFLHSRGPFTLQINQIASEPPLVHLVPPRVVTELLACDLDVTDIACRTCIPMVIVLPTDCLSVCLLPDPSINPSLSHAYTPATCPSDHLSAHLYETVTHLSTHPLSIMTDHMHDSSQS